MFSAAERRVVGQFGCAKSMNRLFHVIPTAVSEHAHSSACEQAGGTLRLVY
jgi:hypothetical protein